MTKENTSIVVCGKKFDTGARVILWNEPEGMSFYPYNKFGARNASLKELRKEINSFVIHHSVTYFAESTFRVLKTRNLSCNFIIDDNVNEYGCADIYQCLDVKDYGYSQGKHNKYSAGVEISYMPDAWDHPNRYNSYNRKRWGVQDHKIVSDKIHGMDFKKVFAPTEAQVNACIQLIHGYSKAFPDLKLSFPRDDKGNFISTIPPKENMVGLLHHFNITKRKIDAMGFPTDAVEAEVKRLAASVETKPPSKLLRSWIIDKLFGNQ